MLYTIIKATNRIYLISASKGNITRLLYFDIIEEKLMEK